MISVMNLTVDMITGVRERLILGMQKIFPQM